MWWLGFRIRVNVCFMYNQCKFTMFCIDAHTWVLRVWGWLCGGWRHSERAALQAKVAALDKTVDGLKTWIGENTKAGHNLQLSARTHQEYGVCMCV